MNFFADSSSKRILFRTGLLVFEGWLLLLRRIIRYCLTIIKRQFVNLNLCFMLMFSVIVLLIVAEIMNPFHMLFADV